jgi:hypothetical protein
VFRIQRVDGPSYKQLPPFNQQNDGHAKFENT